MTSWSSSGGLGAGKTTLTQGIGGGLDISGAVTSPTFVIARVHRSRSGGPDLVHVDAYRVGSRLEVDDLDLDASLPDSVTVVEWGAGKVEGLAADRLVVTLARAEGSTDDETRTVTVTGFGARWTGDGGRRPRDAAPRRRAALAARSLGECSSSPSTPRHQP